MSKVYLEYGVVDKFINSYTNMTLLKANLAAIKQDKTNYPNDLEKKLKQVENDVEVTKKSLDKTKDELQCSDIKCKEVEKKLVDLHALFEEKDITITNLCEKIKSYEEKILELENNNKLLLEKLNEINLGENIIDNDLDLSEEQRKNKIIQNNLDKVPLREITVKDNKLTNYKIILIKGKLLPEFSSTLTDQEKKIRKNIRYLIDPKKTEKRKISSKKYYEKKKNKNNSV